MAVSLNFFLHSRRKNIMAMVVKNNMSAISTLNTLNKNSSALAKSLEKVSSGMKVNSAADDASGYAISERMRVQIRSLDQANNNTQSGNAMMKVAEGAVSSTVDILKTLKEKVINAANDTNTDSDRQTIQKELNQSIDQIDDNANVTYNGKYLVDGSKNTMGNATYTSLTNQSLSTDTTASTAITALAARNGDALEIDSTDKVTVSYVQGGKTFSTSFQVGSKNLKDIFDAAENIDLDNKIFADQANDAYQSALTGQPIDGTDVSTAVSTASTAVSTATSTFSTARTTWDTAQSTYSTATDTYSTATSTYNNDLSTYNAARDAYAAAGSPASGTAFNTWTAASSTYVDANNTYTTAQSTYNVATSTYNTASTTFSTAVNTYNDSAAGTQLLTGANVGVAASTKIVSTADSSKAITVLANTSGISGQISGFNISVSDSEGNVKKSANAALDAFGETVRAQNKSEDNAITLQVGAKANQSIKVGLTDMRSEALGLKGSDGTKLNISTQTKANAAINVLDNALQKALDQQTTIGSVESRLSYTSSNLTTASENVQSSESTIRDADMAKEMTEYTKNNVLLQAAQSMLAQANQSSSSVLSLLQ
jgi:flagellin